MIFFIIYVIKYIMEDKEYFKYIKEKDNENHNSVHTGLIIAYLWFFSFGIFMKTVSTVSSKNLPNWLAWLSILLLFVPVIGPLVSAYIFYHYS